jgi:predicted acylesterase/phospholipase RssA
MAWALLLSGGSALGAVQVPVIEALVKRHGLPGTVCGTSVGAVNALLVGEGRVSELREVWLDVADKGRGWFMRLNADPWHGLFSLNPLRRQIENREAGKRLKAVTRVGVTNLARGSHRMIELNAHPWGRRVDAAICSSAQPLIHERERFRGRWLNDGGVVHVMPTLTDHAEYGFIAAVFASPIGDDRSRPKMPQDRVDSAIEQGLAALDLLTDGVAQADYSRVQRWEGPDVEVYAPSSWDAVGGSFDATEQIIHDRLAEGARMAQAPVWSS